MSYAVWQPGFLYQPGDIVVPITMPSPGATAVVNGDFSAGASGWDYSGGAAYVSDGHGFGGVGCVRLPGNVASGLALNQTRLIVPVGKSITASCMIEQGASTVGATRGWVEVQWYAADDTPLGSPDKGNEVNDGRGGAWHRSSVTATCPAGAAYCRAGIALWSVADHNYPIWGDALQVSGTFAGLPSGLAYRAVQSESGFSAASEPAWPPILGQQVIDNEVTWEAISATRVVWTAEPLYVSGTVEPDWPQDDGGMVKDGSVTFRAVSRRVEDPNCPNTKIVGIAASKVFCADDDIVRYSATVNPLDWSSSDDAGYLPTGLQNYGANPVEAMGLYRGNLIPFNAEAFQLWQVDEDPASMALLDALPMGSTQHHAMAPVSNDLFFLASQGVRTVGIAASSTNFQAGDVGMPIDPLVQAAMADGVAPLGLYFPAAGQYWLMFPRETDTHVFVYTMTRIGQVGAWSRYEFPFVVEDWAIAGDSLYLRSGDHVHRVDETVLGDEVMVGDDPPVPTVVPFPGLIRWPWLDFGQPGVTKMLYGFDVVGTGAVSVSFGIDQSNGGLFTPGYPVPADTVPGMVIPMPLAAASLAVELRYDGSEQWQWNALQLYLQDSRPMS
ncbi:hypothetical protein ARC78_14850 [Stenotrophomonas pictorum JCM 9942]|uniref:Uncharacterized protein n=1 Tax=Stenotrophomonas pictorum JCM 9942 TaxID=1236960 RepID=A0A0R0AC83_9GAMM|nr:hypothetical protein [Stenotrophomonas pictorum]KRG39095.1 hypothetical protein ARC78_14850 [Stenotrophomonas pictorum JCM 9942]